MLMSSVQRFVFKSILPFLTSNLDCGPDAKFCSLAKLWTPTFAS